MSCFHCGKKHEIATCPLYLQGKEATQAGKDARQAFYDARRVRS